MPHPIKYNEKWANEEPQELLLDFLYQLSREGTPTQDEARAIWERHIWECDERASTSEQNPSEKEKDAEILGTLFEQESYFIVFDDILGALVVARRVDREIPMQDTPLPQAPILEEVLDEEEATDMEEEEKEEEKEEGKEEEKDKDTKTESTQMIVDDPNTTLTVYHTVGSIAAATQQDDHVPITRGELRAMESSI